MRGKMTDRGGRGGRGGSRGGGRGGTRTKEAMTKIVTNQVELDLTGMGDKFTLYSILAKGPNDEHFNNPKLISWTPGTDRIGNRAFVREANKFLTAQFGSENYAYDEGQLVLLSPGAVTPPAENKWDFTIFERNELKMQRIECSISISREDSLQSVKEIEQKLNSIVINAFKREMDGCDGFIENKNTFFPEGDIGKKLDDLIDTDSRTVENDMKNLQPFQAKRGFQTRVVLAADMNATPPPMDITDQPMDVVNAELARKAYRCILSLLIRTGCFIECETPLLDLIMNRKGRLFRGTNPAETLKMNNVKVILKGLVVRKNEACYPTDTKLRFDRELFIERVADQTARTHKFMKDDVEVSVFDYMNTAYGIQLKHPDAPLIKLKGGTEFIPAELLILPKQTVPTFGTEIQNYFTNVSRISTFHSKSSLEVVLSQLTNNRPADKYLSSWNVYLGSEEGLMTVNAVEVADPSIAYRNKAAEVARGTWNMKDMVMQQFNTQLANKHVLFMDFGSPSDHIFQQFVDETLSVMKDRLEPGVGFRHTTMPKTVFQDLLTERQTNLTKVKSANGSGDYARNMSDVICNYFAQMLNFQPLGSDQTPVTPIEQLMAVIKANVAHLFVCLPDPATHGQDFTDYIYCLVKNMFDHQSIPSQCFRPDKTPIINGKNEHAGNTKQHISALIAGSNIKSGAYNHSVSTEMPTEGPHTMFIGCDLQPSQLTGSGGKVNTAALVGSWDETFTQFVGAAACQEYKDDIVEDMQGMVRNLVARRAVKQSAQYGGAYDIHEIVYFRDGCDHASHEAVLKNEVPGILAAIAECQETPVKITVIICMKRHSFRMFPVGSCEDGKGGFMNVVPGTCAGITIGNFPVACTGPTPMSRSIFCMGHNPIGSSTGRPLRATVIRNDSGMTDNQIAQLMFSFAHFDQVVTKSVSLPGPAMYAHKLCEYVRKMIEYELGRLDSTDRESYPIKDISCQQDRLAGNMSNCAYL